MIPNIRTITHTLWIGRPGLQVALRGLDEPAPPSQQELDAVAARHGLPPGSVVAVRASSTSAAPGADAYDDWIGVLAPSPAGVERAVSLQPPVAEPPRGRAARRAAARGRAAAPALPAWPRRSPAGRRGPAGRHVGLRFTTSSAPRYEGIPAPDIGPFVDEVDVLHGRAPVGRHRHRDVDEATRWWSHGHLPPRERGTARVRVASTDGWRRGLSAGHRPTLTIIDDPTWADELGARMSRSAGDLADAFAGLSRAARASLDDLQAIERQLRAPALPGLLPRVRKAIRAGALRVPAAAGWLVQQLRELGAVHDPVAGAWVIDDRHAQRELARRLVNRAAGAGLLLTADDGQLFVDRIEQMTTFRPARADSSSSGYGGTYSTLQPGPGPSIESLHALVEEFTTYPGDAGDEGDDRIDSIWRADYQQQPLADQDRYRWIPLGDPSARRDHGLRNSRHDISDLSPLGGVVMRDPSRGFHLHRPRAGADLPAGDALAPRAVLDDMRAELRDLVVDGAAPSLSEHRRERVAAAVGIPVDLLFGADGRRQVSLTPAQRATWNNRVRAEMFAEMHELALSVLQEAGEE